MFSSQNFTRGRDADGDSGVDGIILFETTISFTIDTSWKLRRWRQHLVNEMITTMWLKVPVHGFLMQSKLDVKPAFNFFPQHFFLFLVSWAEFYFILNRFLIHGR